MHLPFPSARKRTKWMQQFLDFMKTNASTRHTVGCRTAESQQNCTVMYAERYDKEYKSSTRSITQTLKCPVAASYGRVMEFTSTTVALVTRQTAWFTCYGAPAQFTYGTKQFFKISQRKCINRTKRLGTVAYVIARSHSECEAIWKVQLTWKQSTAGWTVTFHCSNCDTNTTHTFKFWRRVNSWPNRNKLCTWAKEEWFRQLL